MFEIIVTRMWDGRYLAVIPGIHYACSQVAPTLQGAVRMAQASALNLMADFIRGNRPMPAAMKDWFYTVSAEGSTPVGGVQHNTVKDELLMHPENNTIPKRPPSQSKVTLPKSGTPEYDAFMAGMVRKPRSQPPVTQPPVTQPVTPAHAPTPAPAPATPPKEPVA